MVALGGVTRPILWGEVFRWLARASSLLKANSGDNDCTLVGVRLVLSTVPDGKVVPSGPVVHEWAFWG